MEKSLEKQVEQQKKLIDFMRKKFREGTGKEIELPQTWEKLLDIAEEEAPIVPLEQAIEEEKTDTQAATFAEAVTALNLPARLADAKKSKDGDGKKKPALTTNFDPTNKFHMVEVINLSGFQFKVPCSLKQKFSKNRLRDFVESISDMRCLHSLILQNNGIDDSCVEELDAILAIKRIVRLDLSRNRLDRMAGSAIARTLSSCSHLEWLEQHLCQCSLSRNHFNFDYVTCSLILNSIKLQTKMYHFCMDIQQTKENKERDLPANFTAILRTKPNFHSLGPIDTRISQAAMKNLCTALQGKDNRLTSLNFNFCYLQQPEFAALCKSLNINRTLIKLNLSNNGLSNALGIMLAEVLKVTFQLTQNNITLVMVSLSRNNLGDMFAEALARSLEVNQVITSVDIAGNLIETEGAQRLIKCLTESNDTLESLGDLTDNLTMGVYNIQRLKKALRINTVSKQLRKKILAGNGQEEMTAEQVANSQTLAFLQAEYNDYKLVRPIEFTNAYSPDDPGFRLWNIR